MGYDPRGINRGCTRIQEPVRGRKKLGKECKTVFYEVRVDHKRDRVGTLVNKEILGTEQNDLLL